MRRNRGRVVMQWTTEDRHTGEEVTITVRESDKVMMNRFLRDVGIKRVVTDGERRAKNIDDTHRSAA